LIPTYVASHIDVTNDTSIFSLFLCVKDFECV